MERFHLLIPEPAGIVLGGLECFLGLDRKFVKSCSHGRHPKFETGKSKPETRHLQLNTKKDAAPTPFEAGARCVDKKQPWYGGGAVDACSSEKLNAGATGGVAQAGVERGEREPLAQRQFQVGGVVGRKVMFAGHG